MLEIFYGYFAAQHLQLIVSIMAFIHRLAVKVAELRLDEAGFDKVLAKSSNHPGMFAPFQPFSGQQGVGGVEEGVVSAVHNGNVIFMRQYQFARRHSLAGVGDIFGDFFLDFRFSIHGGLIVP